MLSACEGAELVVSAVWLSLDGGKWERRRATLLQMHVRVNHWAQFRELPLRGSTAPHETASETRRFGNLTRRSGSPMRHSGSVTRSSRPLPRTSWQLPRTSRQLPRTSGRLPRRFANLTRSSGHLTRHCGNLTRPGRHLSLEDPESWRLQWPAGVSWAAAGTMSCVQSPL